MLEANGTGTYFYSPNFIILQLMSKSKIVNNEGKKRKLVELDSTATTALTDREILTRLFRATDGENWSGKKYWGSLEPLHEWRGVTLNGRREVTRLNLSSRRLSGRCIALPLDSLYLMNSPSYVTGEIPSIIGSLAKLTRLSLHKNELRGTDSFMCAIRL